MNHQHCQCFVHSIDLNRVHTGGGGTGFVMYLLALMGLELVLMETVILVFTGN